MKKILVQKLADLFTPRNMQDVDAYAVLDALSDGVVRKAWLFEILQEIKHINVDIDQKIFSGDAYDIPNLSSRRRALQFVLDAALSAKREAARTRGHNLAQPGQFDLESVTVLPAPK